MYEPEDAVVAGFLDRAVPADALEGALSDVVSRLKGLNCGMHALAKLKLRRQAMAAIRHAIDSELTLEAYQANVGKVSAVVLPGSGR